MQRLAARKTNSRKYSLRDTELRLYRSLAISLLGQDPEGAYRPEFVERVLDDARERSTQRFTTPEAFLAALRSV